MTKTELVSPYYFGLEGNFGKSHELKRKVQHEANKAMSALINGAVNLKAKNYRELYFNKMYAKGEAYPGNLH